MPSSVVNLVQGSGASLGDGADRHVRRRLHLVHRRIGHRQDHLQGRRRTRHQGGGRTRREESAHSVRRRRMGELGRPGAHRRVPAFRPGVLGGHPGDRRGVHRRRLRRRTRRSARRRSGWATAWTRQAKPARWCPSNTGPRSKPMSRLGISEGARLVTGGARPERPGAGRVAASTCRRSSTNATGRCESSRGDLRSDSDGGAVHRRGRGDQPSATIRNTVSRRAFGRPIRREASAWCGHCGTARCGSTISATTPPPRSGADSGSRATAANSGPTGLAEYQEIKHIWHNTAPTPAGWFTG